MFTASRVRNPILVQEVNYQRRTASRFWGYIKVFGPLALCALFGLLVLSLSQVINNQTREITIFAIWFVHAIVVTRCVIAGANAISREHVGQTWDALILTGVSTRQILFGKWMAANRRVAPWMLALGAFRLAALPLFTMALVTRFAWRFSAYNMSATGVSPNPAAYSAAATTPSLPMLTFALEPALLAALLIVLLTILEIMACTAIGIAASAITRRGVMAMILAFCIRFAPVVIFAGFTRYEVGDSARSWQVLRFPALALADSGTSPLIQLMIPLRNWDRNVYYQQFNFYRDALGGILLATGLLLILLSLSMLVAWFAIRTSGALPHATPEERGIGRAFQARTAGTD